MPTNVQPNISLVVKLGAASYECQFITASFKLPGTSQGTRVETACPGGVVTDPGTVSNGSFTGEAYTDTTDTGLYKALDTAYASNAVLAYELTFFPELGATKGVKYTGNARVNSLQLDFSKPGNSKHPVDLAIETAVFSRPTAAMAEAA